LQTTGKLLDIPEAANWMTTYFKHIRQFADDQRLSSRVRFMFRDLFELRQHAWVPRRAENLPKTISQVHDEALQRDFEERLLSEEVLANPAFATTAQRSASNATTIAVDVSSKKFQKRQPSSGAVAVLGTQQQQQQQQTKKPTAAGTKLSTTSVNAPSGLSTVDESTLSVAVQQYVESPSVQTYEVVLSVLAKLKNIGVATVMRAMVFVTVLTSLDKGEHERERASRLLARLHNERHLSESQFVDGFQLLLAQLEDIKLDIPFAATHLSKVLGLALRDGVVSASAVAVAHLDSAIPSVPLNCNYSSTEQM
jgi:hypothetical protein